MPGPPPGRASAGRRSYRPDLAPLVGSLGTLTVAGDEQLAAEVLEPRSRQMNGVGAVDLELIGQLPLIAAREQADFSLAMIHDVETVAPTQDRARRRGRQDLSDFLPDHIPDRHLIGGLVRDDQVPAILGHCDAGRRFCQRDRPECGRVGACRENRVGNRRGGLRVGRSLRQLRLRVAGARR